MANLSPETLREIEKLAAEMGQVFSPPEFIPGCEVLSVADKDEYDTDNGWIEAICGQHNNQRCRFKAKFAGVQVGDYVDVLYFKSIQMFEVFAKGGDGNVNGLPITTNGDLLGFSTLPDRYPISGNDGYVLTEDSTADFGFAWKPPVALATYYFHDAAADVATYEQALLTPTSGSTVTDSVSVSAATSPQLIDSYVTYPTTGIGITLIPAGVWNFIIWGRVGTVVGVSTILIRVYQRDTGGTETLLFSVETPALTASNAEYDVTYVQPADIFISDTDRLVFKVYGTTTSVPARTVYWLYEGTTMYSHVETPLQVSSAVAGGGWPFANEKTVDPTDAEADYTTVTLAIAGASAGDTLVIGNDTYSESVTVNKKLYLTAHNAESVIITHNATSGFTTSTADCVIENVTIKNTTGGASGVIGILVQANVTYRNCIIDMSGITTTVVSDVRAISVSGAYTVTLENCTILYGDASASVLIGVYTDHASAVVNIIGGSITNTATGGSKTDIYANAGTVNLRDVELGDGTLYTSGSGVYNGQYTKDGVIYSLDNILGIESLYPNIGSTTDANKFGNIYLSNGKDIYLNGQGRPLAARYTDRDGLTGWTSHFRTNDAAGSGELTAYAWMSATGIFTTASFLDYDNANDYMRVRSSSTSRAFMYKSISTYLTETAYFTLMLGDGQIGGLRIDDGGNTANDRFCELYLEGASGNQVAKIRYQNTVSGGVTTVASSISHRQGDPFSLAAYMDDLGSGNWRVDGYIVAEVGNLVNIFIGGTGAWTPTRIGLFVQNTGQPAYFDKFNMEDF